MKTLLERIQDQFKKVNITFVLDKQTYQKYIGIIIDDNTMVSMPYEIPKCVQVNRVKQYAESTRNMLDMYIKIYKKDVK